MSIFKVFYCSAFSILFLNTVKAQSTNQFLPDTATRFEVGVNTTPAIIFAVGAESAQNYVLSFRKQHNKSAFQIKAVFNQAMHVSNPPPNITLEDSILTKYQTFIDPEKYVGVAGGIEFYNPKRRIRWYWGFDLLVRYYINVKSQSTESYVSNSSLGPVLPYPTLYLSAGTLESYQWATGGGIKGGVRFPISYHFSLQTESHFHFVYLFPATYKISGDQAYFTKNTYSGFDLYSDGLIPEVTLFYRF